MALDGVTIWAVEIRGWGWRRRTLDVANLDRLRGGAGVVGLTYAFPAVGAKTSSSSSSLSASSDELPPSSLDPTGTLGDECAWGE